VQSAEGVYAAQSVTQAGADSGGFGGFGGRGAGGANRSGGSSG
jgi:hypothetical protein